MADKRALSAPKLIYKQSLLSNSLPSLSNLPKLSCSSIEFKGISSTNSVNSSVNSSVSNVVIASPPVSPSNFVGGKITINQPELIEQKALTYEKLSNIVFRLYGSIVMKVPNDLDREMRLYIELPHDILIDPDTCNICITLGTIEEYKTLLCGSICIDGNKHYIAPRRITNHGVLCTLTYTEIDAIIGENRKSIDGKFIGERRWRLSIVGTISQK
jgi:hypothetical protein